MSEGEEKAAADRAAIVHRVVRIVEEGLTPFINRCLAEIHGTTDYVSKENERRETLREKGSRIHLLKADATSTRWDYSEILNTITGYWLEFRKIFDGLVRHPQQISADLRQMLSLRDRGLGHGTLGPFTDEDLHDLCKIAHRVLRVTGAANEAERIRRLTDEKSIDASSREEVYEKSRLANDTRLSEFKQDKPSHAAVCPEDRKQVGLTERQRRYDELKRQLDICYSDVKQVFVQLGFGPLLQWGYDCSYLNLERFKQLDWSQKVAAFQLTSKALSKCRVVDDLYSELHPEPEVDPFVESNTPGLASYHRPPDPWFYNHADYSGFAFMKKVLEQVAKMLWVEADHLFDAGRREIDRQTSKILFRNYSKALTWLDRAAAFDHPKAKKWAARLRVWGAPKNRSRFLYDDNEDRPINRKTGPGSVVANR